MAPKGPNPLILLALTSVSFAAFAFIVKRRFVASSPASTHLQSIPRSNSNLCSQIVMPAIFDKLAGILRPGDDGKSEQTPTSPVFDHNKVTVIFVLGGPGAGKGTQCSHLVADFGFCHLSAGDLLRAEQNREGSQFGELIHNCIKEGTIVPMEVTIKLLENAMSAALKESPTREGWGEDRGRFLIDGFPRKMDQALKFDEEVCRASLVLFFSTTEQVMLDRLLERGKTSGREDDNAESIKKRFVTYKETTMPVIQHYEALGKVAEIDSSPSVEEVHLKAKEVVAKILQQK
ncbi:uridylate kinase [Favolaschia claudopus]|uniref:Uridylate kinase n=1 Tax=Favolaschia claudopus TaxID=2862362 RepID=A0AAW0AP89_9AGAR